MCGGVCGEAKNNQAALIEVLIGQTGASEKSILCNENFNRESARCAHNVEQKQQKIIHASGSRSVVGVRDFYLKAISGSRFIRTGDFKKIFGKWRKGTD